MADTRLWCLSIPPPSRLLRSGPRNCRSQMLASVTDWTRCIVRVIITELLLALLFHQASHFAG
jgi:hypothetical protein